MITRPYLEQPEPLAALGIRHGRLLEALADTRVPFLVDGGQPGMRRVPHLRRQFVPSNEALELLLVLGATPDEPVGPRVAHPVTEHEVQPPRDLVDEVVHVALQASIVVAREEKTALAVEEGPAREVDGAHAGEVTAVVDVSGAVVEQPQGEDESPTAKETRLRGPDGRELVRDVMVLQVGQRSHPPGVWGWHDLRVRTLAPAKLVDEHREIEQQDGS